MNGLTADAADPSMSLSNLRVYYMRPHNDWKVSKQLQNLTLGLKNGVEIDSQTIVDTQGSPRVPKGSLVSGPRAIATKWRVSQEHPRAAQERPRSPQELPKGAKSSL